MSTSKTIFATTLFLGSLGWAGAIPALRASAGSSGFGSAIATGADLDEDRSPELLIGAPHFGSRSGQVVVFSGASGRILRTIQARGQHEEFGRSVAFLGDLNGDDVADFAVGAPLASRLPESPSEESRELAGRVTIFSGKDGAVIRDLWGKAHEHFGAAVTSVPDLDGDKVEDLLVGAPIAAPNGLFDAGIIRAFSGKTGTQLFQHSGQRKEVMLGEAMATLGDLDGDGLADFAAGGSNGRDDAEVRLCSGASGAVLRVLKPSAGWKFFGQSVAPAGDVNRDGVTDLLVGAPGARGDGGVLVGLVVVYSGKDGTVLRQIPGSSNGEEFGVATTSLGDLNGDGVPDFCAGAGGPVSGESKGSGLVRAVSGKDGTPLWELRGTVGRRLGRALAPTLDRDGDGVPDLVCGAPGADEVWIVSGKTGSVLSKLRPAGN